jgi:1,4-dihydroxy-2-naphthoyl-CoA hydrolase
MIWHKPYKIEELDFITTLNPDGNILTLLDIEYVEIGDDFITMKMPVDTRTHQVQGILHGGATCVLAETVGSIASLLVIDTEKYNAVGSTIYANHLRPIRDGHVYATARPVHLGRTKHVWEINVESNEGKLVAKCELTCAVINK